MNHLLESPENRSAHWTVRVNASASRRGLTQGPAGEVAAMFGFAGEHVETLYEDFTLTLQPGRIVAVVGPSGSGKSVLLREVARQLGPDAVGLKLPRGPARKRPAVELLSGGTLKDRLAALSRVGLAEATALLAPAGQLSDGQQTRLALGRALHEASLSARPRLVVVDEFCSVLDLCTAAVLCRSLRRAVRGSPLGVLLATPRTELLAALKPSTVLVKPLGEPVRRLRGMLPGPRVRLPEPRRWRIVRGSIADYRALSGYHYLTGPPAAHKRVWVVRTPQRYLAAGAPTTAAVLVVSPPVIGVRGRNLATDGRYLRPDRRAGLGKLNREVECISRVVVHPVFRGCGLAARLVRHALDTAELPLVEALAAMGKIHPFFVRGGMQPVGLFRGRTQYYHYFLATTGDGE